MQVSVEKLSNIERRLTIIVPANEVEAAYVKQIDIYAKKADLKGFRRGKVPRNFIEKQFGGDARQEALSHVIERNLLLALQEHQLRPVSPPKVEPKILNKDEPLEFTASFEVLPTLEAINFTMDNVEKMVADITDEDADFVIEQLRKQFTKWHQLDREVRAKDRVVIDYYAIFEGKSDIENTVRNFPLELGSNIMLPGFEEGLVGAKVGEEKTLNIKFPDDFNIAEKAGKPVDFVVNIKEAYEAETPDIDEGFVKRLGITSGTMEDLKSQIKQTLETERNRLVTEKLKQQVFKSLIEQNVFEIPQNVIDQEAQNLHDEVYKDKKHDHASHSAEEMNNFRDIAKQRVMLGVLIAEYAKQQDIKADKNKVFARIKEIAAIYENPQEVMQWLSSEGRLAGIEAQVLEDQVLDHLLQSVPVTEKKVSYAQLKSN